MKMIVTGLSGLVGTRLRQMFEDKYNFVNVDLATGVDITDISSVKKALEESGGDALVHLAAFTDVAGAHQQVGDKNGVCYKVNVNGTRNVAQCCKEMGVYMVQVSTDYVFDGKKDGPYVETDSPKPVDWYGQTKWWAEQEVEKVGGEHTILRLAFPYLANPMRPDLLVKIVDQIENNNLPPQFADNMVTPTFVDDFCKAIDAVLTKRPGGVFHATGSSWHSAYEIATMIKKAFGLGGNIEKGSQVEFSRRTGRPLPQKLMISNQKLASELGLKMKTFSEGLAKVKSQLS